METKGRLPFQEKLCLQAPPHLLDLEVAVFPRVGQLSDDICHCAAGTARSTSKYLNKPGQGCYGGKFQKRLCMVAWCGTPGPRACAVGLAVCSCAQLKELAQHTMCAPRFPRGPPGTPGEDRENPGKPTAPSLN